MGGDSPKRGFRPGREAHAGAAYPEASAGRRAFLRQLGLLGGGALAAPVLIRCYTSTEGVPSPLSSGIRLMPTDPVLLTGEVQPFTAVDDWGYDQPDGGLSSRWTSSKPGVARIDDRGRAEALGPGVTVISAEHKGHVASTNLTVIRMDVLTLAIVPATFTLPVGGTYPLWAIAYLAGGGEQNMTSRATWSSSDPSVVTVSNEYSAGEVKGVAPGKATITASISAPKPGFKATAEIEVT